MESTLALDDTRDASTQTTPGFDWVPLSASQRMRWFAYRLNPEQQGEYNGSFAARIRGELDPERLSQALSALVQRHPLLSVRICEQDGRLQQQFVPHRRIPVQIHDACTWNAEALRLSVERCAKRPFDLSEGPLLRADLYSVAPSDQVLLVAVDHMVCDAWSFWQIIQQLGELLCVPEGQKDEKSEPAYFEYVREQERWLGSPQAAKQFERCRAALEGCATALDLPVDSPSLSPSTITGHSCVTHRLPATLLHELRALAARHRASLYTVLLAGYLTLLHRYSGQERITVGAPVPARGDGRWDAVVGCFFNQAVLPATFEPGLAVSDLLN